MAAVKADAYGHGAAQIAQTLVREKNGADSLGVATCEEGVALRQSGISVPILIMGFTPESLFEEAIRHGLTQTVFCAQSASVLAQTATRLNTRADVHIKIDTGMGRLGFLPQPEAIARIVEAASLSALRVSGIYTHFATSDALDNSFMHEQQARFHWVRQKLGEQGLTIPDWHMANSGAFVQALRGRPYADAGVFLDGVRIGILLYGMLPSAELCDACKPLALRPVMRLLTQVGMVKTLPKGSGVSYGHMFRTTREARIATLPVGYADGYPRRLSNQARVLVNGHYAPIVGAICMDQCMVDVTDIPGVAVGDEVLLVGDGISMEQLAQWCGTINYEACCRVSARVQRVYAYAGETHHI
jgi:alanine racemase